MVARRGVYRIVYELDENRRLVRIVVALVLAVYFVLPKVLFPAIARRLRERRPDRVRRRYPWSFLGSQPARVVFIAVAVAVVVLLRLALPREIGWSALAAGGGLVAGYLAALIAEKLRLSGGS
jgi:hypothetical protein